MLVQASANQNADDGIRDRLPSSSKRHKPAASAPPSAAPPPLLQQRRRPIRAVREPRQLTFHGHNQPARPIRSRQGRQLTRRRTAQLQHQQRTKFPPNASDNTRKIVKRAIARSRAVDAEHEFMMGRQGPPSRHPAAKTRISPHPETSSAAASDIGSTSSLFLQADDDHDPSFLPEDDELVGSDDSSSTDSIELSRSERTRRHQQQPQGSRIRQKLFYTICNNNIFLHTIFLFFEDKFL